MAQVVSTPRHPQAFFGRDVELTELKHLLAKDFRLITIVAPGGYGKSRVALELCASLAGDFAGGICEIPLAAVGDPARIARAAADALALHLYDDSDPMGQLLDYLREKEMLLHFDNFEHLIAGAHFIETLLQETARISVLVTSREPLQLAGEQIYSLQALPVGGAGSTPLPMRHPSAAALLFTDRAAAVVPGFALHDENAAEIDAICHTLEGVPLAIELTAVWADTYSLMELKRELDQQLDITAKANDLPERHLSVRASCDWSYRLLTEEEQLVLRCVSLFRGGFFIEHARDVLPVANIDDVLSSLAVKSWLYVHELAGQSRYYMHNAAIREYGFQLLLASDDFEVAVLAHCRLFANLVERECVKLRTAEQLEAVRTLGRELENIYEALDTTLRRDDPSLVVAFARNLFEFLLLSGGASDCLVHYTAIKEYCESRQEPRVLLFANLGLAAANLQLGRYKQARDCGQAALRAAHELAEKHSHAQADTILGEISRLEGRHLDAHRHFNSSLETMRGVERGARVAAALHGLERIEVTEGNYVSAGELINESLEIRRQSGDQFGVASCLNDQGNIEYRKGNYDSACSLHTESLEIQRKLNDRRGIAQSLNNLGNVEFSRCDYPAAWALYSESLAIRRDIGERFGIAANLNNLGNVEYCKGNYQDARTLHLEGLDIKREIGDRIGISYSLNNLGNIAIKMEQYGEAALALREALQIALDLSSKECQLAPLAVSASLFARAACYHAAGVLCCGASEQCTMAGLALDPMDGGMLEEARHLLSDGLPAAELRQLEETAGEMTLEELSRFALHELDTLEDE